MKRTRGDDAGLYSTLGVPPDAPHALIRRAFHREALRCHPDKAPQGADEQELLARSERFKALAAAYEILQDPATRANYDATGRVGGFSMGGGQAAASSREVFARHFGTEGEADPVGTVLHVSPDRVFNLPLFEAFLVIDPRSAAEFARGSLPTAVSWPPGDDGTWPSVEAWARQHADDLNFEALTPIVVCGREGDVAEILASLLRAGPSPEVQAYGSKASADDPALDFLKKLHSIGRHVWLLDGGAEGFRAAFPGLCRVSSGADLKPTPHLIAPNLFLGSRAVPTPRLIAPNRWSDDEGYLREVLGITTVLTSQEQGVAFKSLGLNVLAVDVHDDDVDVGDDLLTAACDGIDGVLADGGTVMIFVHGRSRSAPFALAWLVRAHGLPAQLAAQLLKSQCPLIDWTLLQQAIVRLKSWAEGKVAIHGFV